jgi:hypothetical protein
MLTHSADPAFTLIELSDLAEQPLPGPLARHEAPLRAVVAWAQEYLCRPHQDLGRTGNVCPFVQPSIDRGMLYLSVVPGAEPDADAVAARLRLSREWFEQLSAGAGNARIFGAILTLLPDLPAHRATAVIDGLQGVLKSEFVERGMMIGEFHDGPPDKGGLWNPDFRPLRSPVPMLAMRHMVPTDFLFLQSEPEHVAAYLRLFGDQVPAHLRDRVLGIAR